MLVNEALIDVYGIDAGYQWVELFNDDTVAIDLTDWRIESAAPAFATTHTFASGPVLQPGERWVVGDELVLEADENLPYGTYLGFGDGLADADGIRLVDPSGLVRDTLIYGGANTDALDDDTGAVATSIAAIVEDLAVARVPDAFDTDACADDFLPTEPTPGLPNAVPIPDIRTGSLPQGTGVTVVGIVTATTTDGVYVQDAAGGAYSGIFARLGPGWSVVFGPLLLGDEVRISGVYAEVSGQSRIDVPLATEQDVTVLNAGPLPTAEPLTAGDLDPGTAEMWESVLVQLSLPSVVTDPGLGQPTFTVDDGLPAVIDSVLHDYSVHADGRLILDTPFDAITGIVFDDTGTYTLAPRFDADLDIGASTTLINSIQLGSWAEGSWVEILDACVTAVTDDGVYAQHFVGGPNSGIWLEIGPNFAATRPALSEGNIIRFAGIYSENVDMSQVDLGPGTYQIIGNIVLPGPDLITPQDLDPTAGNPEVWEGVTVAIAVLETQSVDVANGEFTVFDQTTGLYPFVVDDDLHQWSGLGTLAPADPFLAITGQVHHHNGRYELNPRSDADVLP